MTVVIGVGQAGCNLAAEMTRVPNAKDFLDVWLVNSTVRDLVPIRDVPSSRWIGVNETEGLVPLADRKGAEAQVTGGMGKDPQRCFRSLTTVFDRIVANMSTLSAGGKPLADTRFALVAFSAGGGTGAGAAPVVARALREITRGSCRIIGAAILPARTRGDDKGGSLREAWNAWFCIQRSLEVFDGIILVDNERLSRLGDIERGFPAFNKYVARCLTDMVLGNLTELVLPEKDEVVVQQADVMDLTTALSLGSPGERRPGVAAIGRGVQMLQSPLGYVLPFLPPKRPDVVGLGQLASERLTLDGAGADCEKAYLLVRAPTRVLGRSGMGQEVSEVMAVIGRGTRRGEIVFGTALTKRPLLSVTVGYTYDPRKHPRIKALEADAAEYEREVKKAA